jgi:type I restriction enzyme S subunit
VRTYLKNITIVPEELDGALTSTGIAVLRPNAAILPRYLFHWVKSDPFVTAVGKAEDGTVYPAVRDTDVTSANIPLAPLEEQGRIVAKLDSLFNRSSRARYELDRIPQLVARYKQAILAKAFSGELTVDWLLSQGVEEAWNVISVDDVVTAITAGKNLRCLERPPNESENGVVKVSAVTWGTFDPIQSKTLPADFTPHDKTHVRRGDFLISRANTLELVGAVVIVGRAPNNLYLSDKILRLDMEEATKPWLLWYLRSPAGRRSIESSATGNQLSMRNLSQDALKAISLPWPTSEERGEILHRLSAAFDWLNTIAIEHARADHLLPKLDQAILGKAFRGALVPQDPNDEPASKLLERLASQPAQVRKGPQRRKRATISAP